MYVDMLCILYEMLVPRQADNCHLVDLHNIQWCLLLEVVCMYIQ